MRKNIVPLAVAVGVMTQISGPAEAATQQPHKSAKNAAISKKPPAERTIRHVVPQTDEKSKVPTDRPFIAKGKAEDFTVVGSIHRPHLNGHADAGALGTRSYLDTPFSLKTVSAAQIQARQSEELNSVFASDPSATAANSGQGASSGASFKIRGRAVDSLNGYKIDGLSIPGWSVDFPMDIFDNVQLIKGASAFMYGFGSPGGVVNYAMKKPLDTAAASVDVGYRSDSVVREVGDIGGPVDRAGKWTYRLVAFNEEGWTFNGGYMRRDALSLTTAVHITPKLRWYLGYMFFSHDSKDQINTVYVSSSVTHLPTVSGRTQLGANGSKKWEDEHVVSSGLDWDIAPNWTSSLKYQYSLQEQSVPETLLTINDAHGNYTSSALLFQRAFFFNQLQDITEGHFNTGPLKHDVVFGAAWENQIYDYNTASSQMSTLVVDTGNFYQGPPSFGKYQYVVDNFNPKMYRYESFNQVSPFLSDTISWRNISLMGAFRYTYYGENDYNTQGTGALTGTHRDSPLTPVFAVIYKIDPHTSLYASYVKGMQSGSTAPSTARNAYAVFSPITSKQYEFGFKAERQRWALSAAFYRMDSGVGYTGSDNYYVQDGVARYQGFEGSASVLVTPDLTVSGGLNYQDDRYLNAAASARGHRVEGTPTWAATASAHYNVPVVRGLGFDVYFKYVGSMYDNAQNTLLLPSAMTWDLAGSYITHVRNHRLTLRAMVNNLANERYWLTYGSSAVLPGDPRTVSLSARIDF